MLNAEAGIPYGWRDNEWLMTPWPLFSSQTRGFQEVSSHRPHHGRRPGVTSPARSRSLFTEEEAMSSTHSATSLSLVQSLCLGVERFLSVSDETP